MKKFAVILAGCGVYDGAEIHEAVLTLLAIEKHGGQYDVFAPDILQHHVIDHYRGQEMPEKRNVLVEAARIARGKIADLKTLKVENYDAVVLPGGFGAAKNLCDWAFKGSDCEVNENLATVLNETLAADKPIGAMCIAPVILGKLFGNINITIGSDPNDAKMVETMGSKHTSTGHGEVIRDTKYKIFTTPCYMLDASIIDIEVGTANLIGEMMKEM
jgi:enhancing lycopene biosynthesis protein 2